MKKQTFKTGDRVFDIRFGWGTVKEVLDTLYHNYPIIVFFDNIGNVITYASDGSFGAGMPQMLSFTEYTLQGFTQEKPVNYKDYVGKWGVFWDKWWDGYYISKLKGIDINNGFTEFIDSASGKWDKFKPLTEEQMKILKSCD